MLLSSLLGAKKKTKSLDSEIFPQEGEISMFLFQPVKGGSTLTPFWVYP